MRTTIRLPDSLYDQVRTRAVAQHRTVTSFIEESLRASLNDQESGVADRYSVDVFVGTGALPGIDLTNSAALLDAMER